MDLKPCFSRILVEFQNEVASLCASNSINKNVKWTFMVSQYNLKSYLSDTSRTFSIEAVEAVLWLIKHVYIFVLTQYMFD